MVALSVFHYIIWVGGDIIIIHILICTVYMLTSVIKHYICRTVNRASVRNWNHLSYREDQSNLKIYNKILLKKKNHYKPTIPQTSPPYTPYPSPCLHPLTPHQPWPAPKPYLLIGPMRWAARVSWTATLGSLGSHPGNWPKTGRSPADKKPWLVASRPILWEAMGVVFLLPSNRRPPDMSLAPSIGNHLVKGSPIRPSEFRHCHIQ